MNATSASEILALGAITGIRSMAGPMILAFRRGGLFATVTAAMALGEMIADKTALVGDRIALIPLAGRAFMGAVVGQRISRNEGSNRLAGGLLGAASAVLVAHFAHYARRWWPLSNALGGMLEDSIVIGIGACCVSRVSPNQTHEQP
jgi:uncharacterized membrane protein